MSIRMKFLSLSLVRILLNIGITGFACSCIALALRFFAAVSIDLWHPACLAFTALMAVGSHCCWSDEMQKCNSYWTRIASSMQPYASGTDTSYRLPENFCSSTLCVLACAAWLYFDCGVYLGYISAHMETAMQCLVSAVAACILILRLIAGWGSPMILHYLEDVLSGRLCSADGNISL